MRFFAELIATLSLGVDQHFRKQKENEFGGTKQDSKITPSLQRSHIDGHLETIGARGNTRFGHQ